MRTCSIEACGRPHYGRNLCAIHYRHARVRGEVGNPCGVDGCARMRASHGLCDLHAYRLQHHGLVGPVGLSRRAAGEGSVDRNGYVTYHHANGERRLVHRRVMEERLGRALLPGESVHHLNGDRGDNRPENLELWSTVHPYGQRVADQLAWAHELIKLYEGV